MPAPSLGGSSENPLDGFIRDLQITANTVCPTATGQYETVRVKLLAFEEDESDSRTQVHELEHLFRTAFGFRTEVFLIPTDNATLRVRKFLQNPGFTDHSSRGLLIVVYTGISGTIKDGHRERLVLYPHFEGSQGALEWRTIQSSLTNSTFDTLIILDTSQAALSILEVPGQSSAALELLVACGSREDCPTGSRSLSAQLGLVLRDLNGSAITTTQLFLRLLRRGFTTPIHTRRGRHTEIVLQSMHIKPNQSERLSKTRTYLLKIHIIPSAKGIYVDPWERWILEYAPNNILGMDLAADTDPNNWCFTIRLTLQSASIQDYESWTRWIDKAPEDVQSITYDIEPTGSTDDQVSIETFVGHLNFNMGINEALRRRSYRRVTVQPVQWDRPAHSYLSPKRKNENEQELEEMHRELESIGNVFRKRFNYDVKKIWEIPDESDDTSSTDGSEDAPATDISIRAQKWLRNKVNDLIDESGQDKNSLIIIVYGGHGIDTRDQYYGEDEEAECVWCANTSSKSSRVNWTKCIRQLEDAPCDVLMILDCCFSGTAARGTSRSTNEVLAAATPNAVSFSGSRAYSELLKVKLEQLPLPFTAEALHLELLSASKSRISEDPNALLATPDHDFTGRSRTTSIMLRPLAGAELHSIAANEGLGSVKSTPGKPQRSRIFLEVELDHLQGLGENVSEWKNWFTRRQPPPNMYGVRFYTPEDMFVKAIVEKNALLEKTAETETKASTNLR